MEKRSVFSFRKGDFLAIALVALIALSTAAAYLPGRKTSPNASAQLYLNGQIIRELPLSTDTEIEISDQYTNTVCVSGGRICISESDCPGEDCVHSGWISQPGRSIVCLPNRLEIRITGQSDVDFTLR